MTPEHEERMAEGISEPRMRTEKTQSDKRNAELLNTIKARDPKIETLEANKIFSDQINTHRYAATLANANRQITRSSILTKTNETTAV